MFLLREHLKTSAKILFYASIIIAGYLAVFRDRDPFNALNRASGVGSPRGSVTD